MDVVHFHSFQRQNHNCLTQTTMELTTSTDLGPDAWLKLPSEGTVCGLGRQRKVTQSGRAGAWPISPYPPAELFGSCNSVAPRFPCDSEQGLCRQQPAFGRALHSGKEAWRGHHLDTRKPYPETQERLQKTRPRPCLFNVPLHIPSGTIVGSRPCSR